MNAFTWSFYLLYDFIFLNASGIDFSPFHWELLPGYAGVIIFPVIFLFLGRKLGSQLPFSLFVVSFGSWVGIDLIFSRFKSATNFYMVEPGILCFSLCVIYVLVYFLSTKTRWIGVLLSVLSAAAVSLFVPIYGN